MRVGERIPLHAHSDLNDGGRLTGQSLRGLIDPQVTAAPAVDNTTPTSSAPGDVADPGSNGGASHSDHRHGRESGATPSGGYGTAAAGSADTVLLSDAVLAKPTAADVDFSADVTTNNVTTGHHGLAPKLDGNSAHYLDGTGAYSVPAGSGAGTPAGTSFPGSPSTNDLFFRTDLSYLFFYDGTRWLSQQQFVVSIPDRVGGTNLGGVSATTARVLRTGAPPLQGTSDIYIQGWRINYFVSGGTALSASHKWVVTLNKLDSALSATAVSTITIDGGTSSIFREDTTAPNVLLTRATYLVLEVDCTKTGTPGNLIFDSKLAYRLVAT